MPDQKTKVAVSGRRSGGQRIIQDRFTSPTRSLRHVPERAHQLSGLSEHRETGKERVAEVHCDEEIALQSQHAAHDARMAEKPATTWLRHGSYAIRQGNFARSARRRGPHAPALTPRPSTTSWNDEGAVHCL